MRSDPQNFDLSAVTAIALDVAKEPSEVCGKRLNQLLLAAGGIATGRQLAAALVLGADAVSVGTLFVASNEAFAHPEYKLRLVEAADTETRLSAKLSVTVFL